MQPSPIARTIAVAALGAALLLSGCSTASEGIIDVQPAAAVEMLQDPDLVVLDVRSPEEFAAGHLAGALNIDVNSADFDQRVMQLPKDAAILVYCRSGNRSSTASERMAELGFTDLRNVEGGFADLARAGAPVQ